MEEGLDKLSATNHDHDPEADFQSLEPMHSAVTFSSPNKTHSRHRQVAAIAFRILDRSCSAIPSCLKWSIWIVLLILLLLLISCLPRFNFFKFNLFENSEQVTTSNESDDNILTVAGNQINLSPPEFSLPGTNPSDAGIHGDHNPSDDDEMDNNRDYDYSGHENVHEVSPPRSISATATHSTSTTEYAQPHPEHPPVEDDDKVSGFKSDSS